MPIRLLKGRWNLTLGVRALGTKPEQWGTNWGLRRCQNVSKGAARKPENQRTSATRELLRSKLTISWELGKCKAHMSHKTLIAAPVGTSIQSNTNKQEKQVLCLCTYSVSDCTYCFEYGNLQSLFVFYLMRKCIYRFPTFLPRKSHCHPLGPPSMDFFLKPQVQWVHMSRFNDFTLVFRLYTALIWRRLYLVVGPKMRKLAVN